MRRDELGFWVGLVAAGSLWLYAVHAASALSEPVPQGTKEPVAQGMGSLPEPGHLPELARTFLKQRMQRHGSDVEALLRSVVLLRRPEAREAANRIATEPWLVRPIRGSEDALNSSLPELFFILQDQLRDRARTLAQAATAKDDRALAQAYGQVMETCVQCHSAYLNAGSGR
jgi:hypothetical protein